MTAELVGVILQGGFCGVLLLNMWIHARERREELKARMKHWSEEVEVLQAMRDSLVRIETRQMDRATSAEIEAKWLRSEIERGNRRLGRLLDRAGDEVTQVGADPRRRESR